MSAPSGDGHWEEGHFIAAVEQRLVECSRVLSCFGELEKTTPLLAKGGKYAARNSPLLKANAADPVAHVPCRSRRCVSLDPWADPRHPAPADQSATHRLGTLHDKLAKLERTMIMVEARLDIPAGER